MDELDLKGGGGRFSTDNSTKVSFNSMVHPFVDKVFSSAKWETHTDAQLCYRSVTFRQHQNVLTMLKMLLPRWGFLIVDCVLFCFRPLVKIKKSAMY